MAITETRKAENMGKTGFYVFKLRLGALIPRSVGRSVCLSVGLSVGRSVGPPKITKKITKLYKTLQNVTKRYKTLKTLGLIVGRVEG